MNKLAERVEKMLKIREWKLTDLVSKTGKPYSTIREVVKGKTENPRKDTLEAIAKALGITLEELLSDEKDEKLSEMIREIESLDEEDRETIYTVVKGITNAVKEKKTRYKLD